MSGITDQNILVENNLGESLRSDDIMDRKGLVTDSGSFCRKHHLGCVSRRIIDNVNLAEKYDQIGQQQQNLQPSLTFAHAPSIGSHLAPNDIPNRFERCSSLEERLCNHHPVNSFESAHVLCDGRNVGVKEEVQSGQHMKPTTTSTASTRQLDDVTGESANAMRAREQRLSPTEKQCGYWEPMPKIEFSQDGIDFTHGKVTEDTISAEPGYCHRLYFPSQNSLTSHGFSYERSGASLCSHGPKRLEQHLQLSMQTGSLHEYSTAGRGCKNDQHLDELRHAKTEHQQKSKFHARSPQPQQHESILHRKGGYENFGNDSVVVDGMVQKQHSVLSSLPPGRQLLSTTSSEIHSPSQVAQKFQMSAHDDDSSSIRDMPFLDSQNNISQNNQEECNNTRFNATHQISLNHHRVNTSNERFDQGHLPEQGCSNLHNYSPIDTASTNSTENTFQHIQICPGVFGKLREADETIRAYKHGFIAFPVCLICRQDLISIADAEYVLCPNCNIISPVIDDSNLATGRQRCVGGGVCLGLNAASYR
jgi:hypothetical protein